MLLALREITRSRLRFGFLGGAVGLLIFLILFQQALLSGLVTSFIGALENQDSPVVVLSDQARKDVDASFLADDQVEAVSTVDGVAAAAPIGVSTYTVSAGGQLVDGVLFGHRLGGMGQPTSLSEGRRPEGPSNDWASTQC